MKFKNSQKLDHSNVNKCLKIVQLFKGSYFLPESPMWLVRKNHYDQAKKSLQSLRGSNYEVNYELEELKTLAKSREDLTWFEKIKELKTRSNVIPFSIMTVFMILQVK